jgi:hypothetical protein
MPKWNEQPDEGLIRGHEWKIFPLLHRRHVFADVEQFLLYDFFRTNGVVDENVFAYSNRLNEERGLVVYHNRYADTRGWIKTSAAYIDKLSGDLRQKSLAEGLGAPYEGFALFRDAVTHLEYIRSCDELWWKGLYLELGAYQCHAFLDWRFVEDGRWAEIHQALGGIGVDSLQRMWDERFAEKAPEMPKEPAGEAVQAKVSARRARKPAAKKSAAPDGSAPKKKKTAKKIKAVRDTKRS